MECKAQDLFHIVIPAPENFQLLTDHCVSQTVVKGPQNPDECILQRKALQHRYEFLLHESRLRRSDDIDQDLPGPHALPENQVPHQTLMAFLVIKRIAPLPAEFQYCRKDHVEIRIYQLALVHGDDGHEVLLPVHAQGHFAIFDEVAEGILHLVPVSVPGRAPLDGIDPVWHHLIRLQQAADFFFLLGKLLFIRYTLMDAPSAKITVRTDRIYLKIFHISRKTPFYIPGTAPLRWPGGCFSSYSLENRGCGLTAAWQTASHRL